MSKKMNRLQTNDLTDLAEQINQEHEKAERALQEGLSHAVRVGQLLLEAKEQVKHGEWLSWVGENCKFSERTAQTYMRIARNLPELEKSAIVADLGVRDAIGLLAEPKEKTATFFKIRNRDQLQFIFSILTPVIFKPDVIIKWLVDILEGRDEAIRLEIDLSQHKTALAQTNAINICRLDLMRRIGLLLNAYYPIENHPTSKRDQEQAMEKITRIYHLDFFDENGEVDEVYLAEHIDELVFD